MRGYKSVRIHKATPIHARLYLAEKAKIFKEHLQKRNLKKNLKKKIFQKKFLKKVSKKKKKKNKKKKFQNFFSKIGLGPLRARAP